MADKPRVFLDTSVVFAGVLSETGGARLILKLGEAGLVHLVIGPRVLEEADRTFSRKALDSKPLFAILLDVARVEMGKPARRAHLDVANEVIGYAPDAHVLAEAISNDADYFVTLDRKHFHADAVKGLPLLVGTPGDFLAWLRNRIAGLQAP
jgi:predicted nucleic acid-binding protein